MGLPNDHFERLVDRHVANGLPRDQATRRARLEMGESTTIIVTESFAKRV